VFEWKVEEEEERVTLKNAQLETWPFVSTWERKRKLIGQNWIT